MDFVQYLKNAGWAEVAPYTLKKENWIVSFDTSSWIEVGTERTPHIFDVPVPENGKAQWTLNLITHLCKTDDVLQKCQDR